MDGAGPELAGFGVPPLHPRLATASAPPRHRWTVASASRRRDSGATPSRTYSLRTCAAVEPWPVAWVGTQAQSASSSSARAFLTGCGAPLRLGCNVRELGRHRPIVPLVPLVDITAHRLMKQHAPALHPPCGVVKVDLALESCIGRCAWPCVPGVAKAMVRGSAAALGRSPSRKASSEPRRNQRVDHASCVCG